MSLRSRSQSLATRLRTAVIRTCERVLTRPLAHYEQRVPNDLNALRRNLRKGDVVLVEGDQRISQVIRYLTHSSWSHAALYVGDELLRPHYGLRDEVLSRFGESARFLLLEAVVGHGVIASPIDKYEFYNIRICRPADLHPRDAQVVVEEVVRQLGRPYDVQHVWELARFFFPVSLVPARWRRAALQLGTDPRNAVICSSMIAEAFARVGYPILPAVAVGGPPSRRSWWRLRLRTPPAARVRFRRRHPALVTPRDFDLSPYFEIIKFNHLGQTRLDYRSIAWEEAPGEYEDLGRAASA